MWIYAIKQHAMLHGSLVRLDCYSGADQWKNDPLAVHLADRGPLPPGAYTLGSVEEKGPHGPLAIHLVPCPGTQLFGRSGFLWHGDSILHAGQASHGCIISPHDLREEAANGPDRLLIVLPDLAALRV